MIRWPKIKLYLNEHVYEAFIFHNILLDPTQWASDDLWTRNGRLYEV